MKISLFSLLFITLSLSSCGVKNTSIVRNNFDQSDIVLGAFVDVATPLTTFDENKLKELPRVIDLREKMSPVKFQSNRGTCTFFVTAAILEAAIKIDLNKDVNISEEYLSYAAKTNGHFPMLEGSSVPTNMASMKKSGIMLEREWSYQPKWLAKGLPCEQYSWTTAPRECYSHYAPSAEAMKTVISTDSFTIGRINKNTNNIINFLAKNRRPLSASVPVHFNGWPKSGEIYYNEELRKECVESKKCGGHAILLTGYDLNKKVFFFKNSWGKDWGNDGYGTITFETIDLYAEDSFMYAEVSKELALPEDYDKDYLSMENFESSLLTGDKSIDIMINAKVNKAHGRSLLVNSYMFKKLKANHQEATAENTMLLELSEAESQTIGDKNIKALKHFLVRNEEYLDESGLILTLPTTALATRTVLDLFNSTEYMPYIRNDIYVHTDSQGFKLLGRNFQEVSPSHLP